MSDSKAVPFDVSGFAPALEKAHPNLEDITTVFHGLEEGEQQTIVEKIEHLRSIKESDFQQSQSKEINGHLGDALNALLKFEAATKKIENTNRRALKNAFSLPLGRLISLDGLKRALKIPVPRPSFRGRNMDRLSARKVEEILEIRERQQRKVIRDFVDHETPKVLAGLIESLKEGLANCQLMNSALTRRGAPADNVRRYRFLILYCLFKRYGKTSPTTTPEGPFLTFCNDAFEYIGADTKGLDPALSRAWGDIKQTSSS